MDGLGNIYVADTLNATVRRVTPSGWVTTVAGSTLLSRDIVPGPLPARLAEPYGITLTPDGDLLVTSQNSVLQIIAP